MAHRILNRIALARKSEDVETAEKLLRQLLDRHPNDAKALHQKGLLLAMQGRWEEALATHRRCVELDPNEHSYARRLADALLATGHFAEARTLSALIIEREPGFTERDHLRLSLAHSLCGDYRAARDTLVKALSRWRRHVKSPPEGFPIVIAAMPKTASTSIAHALAHALAWPEGELPCYSGPHLFRNGIIIGRNLAQLRDIGYVAHTHMLPRRTNLRTLAAHPRTRVVVHFRDPREALVSALDMIHRTRAPQFLLKKPDLLSLPLNRQVDWMLKHYLPLQVRWMRGWKQAIESGFPGIVTTTSFSDLLREGQDALARRVCERLRLPVADATPTRPRRYGVRKLPDWRELFTPAQKRHAERLIGKALLSLVS